MATEIRKCISLGPRGTITPGSDQDYRSYQTRQFFGQTGTRWVRFWAHWPSLQPDPSYVPGTQTTGWPNPTSPSPANRRAGLIAQLDAARADGLSVVITADSFPLWCNRATVGEVNGRPDSSSSKPSPGVRADEFLAFPDDVRLGSPWAGWIDWLLATCGGRIDALEIVNEPNFQCWPQQSNVGTPNAHCKVATMFDTAKTLRDSRGTFPLLVGPATSDTSDNNADRTNYLTFTENLLALLNGTGFLPGNRFVWSHHNYTDQENDYGTGSSTGQATMRAQNVRTAIDGRWLGRTYAGGTLPQLWLTEGGVRSSRAVGGSSAQRQAELVARNWNRVSTNGEGAGILMATNYLMYDDYAGPWDTGLSSSYLNQFGQPHGGAPAPKPLYYTWRDFPSRGVGL